MPVFNDIPTLRQYVLDTFTANGIGDITGPEARDAFIGILDLLTPQLRQQLVVNLGYGNESLGGAAAGESYAIGTPIEDILRDLLRKPVAPTYIAPTAPLASNVSSVGLEVGQIISPEFTSVYTQNDAGGLTGRSLRRDGVQIATALPHQDLNVSIGLTPIVYQLFTTHSGGACKPNNLGDVDCTGRILGGVILSNTIQYVGSRKTFFGTPVIPVTNSSEVRSALTGFQMNSQAGSEFTIAVPAASLRVAFAYPDSLPDVSQVIDDETGANIKGVFTKVVINVEGANGFAAIPYKLYTFEPVEAFPYSTSYKVKI